MFDRQTDKGTNLPLQDRVCIMHRGKKNCTELVMHVTEYQVMSQHCTGGIEDCDTVAANKQVAQLSQRDRAAGWVSYGQKWKTKTGRQYLQTI